MERNWLIRTHHKQILGPVSKQKLLEFVQKGSIGATDEVTSGNGYWFSLKEKDLVEKYLYGDIPQSFNPVSESKSVLVFRKNIDKTTSLNSSPPNNRITDKISAERVILPAEEDLEYPDMNSITDSSDITQINAQAAEFPDITLISHPPSMPESLKALKEDKTTVVPLPENSGIQLFPDNEDLEYPDIPGMPAPIVPKVESTIELKEEPKIEPKEEIKEEIKEEHLDFKVEVPKPAPREEKKLRKEKKIQIAIEAEAEAPPIPVPTPTPEPRVVSKELEKRNDNYLFVIFFVLLVILFGIFYYYREILNKPLPI